MAEWSGALLLPHSQYTLQVQNSVIYNSGTTAERLIKPKLNKIFNEEGLKITIDPAIQVTDYLDVKLNLSKHSHEPYRSPNDYPLYVNVNYKGPSIYDVRW